MLLKKSKSNDEENAHSDRYLITYADLITLLLGLFVILYVTAQVDDVKYREVINAFSEYFRSPDKNISAMDRGNGLLLGQKNNIPEPIFSNRQPKTLDEIKERTEAKLGKYITSGQVQLIKTTQGLTILLPEKLLFASGRAEVQTEGKQVLDTLSLILTGIEKQVTIDGHSDSQPINNFRYPSNWHLSVARALTVGYTLINRGLPENNVTIRGYGAQRPLAPNESNEGRMKNRRVEITITDLPSNAPSTQGYSAQ